VNSQGHLRKVKLMVYNIDSSERKISNNYPRFNTASSFVKLLHLALKLRSFARISSSCKKNYEIMTINNLIIMTCSFPVVDIFYF